MTFLIFRLTLTLIILTIQWYFYRRTIRYAVSKAPKLVRVVQGLFLLFNAPLLLLIFVRPRLLDLPAWFVTSGIYPFYIWHASFVLLFVILFVLYILRLPFAGAAWLAKKSASIQQKLEVLEKNERFEKWDQSRRLFLQRGFTIIAGTTFAGTAYGTLTKYDYEIERVTIPLCNLPPQFKNFTISLIADIHSSVFMTKLDMQRYAHVINEIGSDLIVIPGDFVNSMVEEVYPLAEAFSELNAPFGIYGTLGNHDFFTNVDAVAREVDACGVKLLRNDRVNIEKDGAHLQLLGVDDVGRPRRATILYDNVLVGTDPHTPRILLCHRPYFFEEAAERKIDLTLSGHTHGGQVVFAKIGPTVIAPALIASPYVAGLYTQGNSQMYVTRGLGTVGIPVRINCPAEITVITLTKAA